MWFKVISLLISVALLGKAIIALLVTRRFYAVRQSHYAAEKRPAKLLVAPVVVLVVAVVTWYATIYHYRPYGWVVTGFVTLISCLSLDHAFRWQKHRARLLKVVANPKVWYVDLFLLALGSGFAALGFFVY